MNKREYVKKIAVNLVTKTGLINLSKRGLCNCAGIPNGSFSHIMGCTFSEFCTELKNESISGPTDVHCKVIKTRTDPDLRKEQILNIAIEIAKTFGCHNLKRDDIASKAGVSVGLVTKYFKTMNKLKRTVMRAAINQNIAEIVALGLIVGDKHAEKSPVLLKTRAQTLINNKSI